MPAKKASRKSTVHVRATEPTKSPVYVPILKWKRGEIRALHELHPSIAAQMLPLIEIVPVQWDYKESKPKETIQEHIADIANNIDQSWGTHPILIDFGLLESIDVQPNTTHPMELVFNDARTKGLHAIPVTGPERDDIYQNAVKAIIRQDNKGVCFRVCSDDLAGDDLTNTINNLLSFFSVVPNQVDLVLDMEAIDRSSQRLWTATAQALLHALPHATDWRSLTLAGTSFPATLSEFQPGSVGRIQRVELALWMTLRGKTLPRMPIFGDYAVAAPGMTELDPRILHISASIRYTIESEWLIFRGRDLRDPRFGGHSQYRTLSQQLHSHPSYYGAGYSWGDKYISDCADGSQGHGNPEMWRKVGTNHHITLTVTQLANLNAASSATLHAPLVRGTSGP